jgi:hypothetical protein
MSDAKPRAVKLSATSAFAIFGWSPQRILTWGDVAGSPGLTLDSLQESSVPLGDCRKIQPSLALWVNAKKATFSNIANAEDWDLNIPNECPDFKLADCIMLSVSCKAQRMKDLGLTLPVLLGTYRMPVQQMSIFPYTMHDWVLLGFDIREHASGMDPETFCAIFNMDPATGVGVYYSILNAQPVAQ